MRKQTIPYTFKLANEPWEKEAIRALNYRTFVGEIPQHSPNDEQALTDRFDAENDYVVAVDPDRRRLLGMVAYRDRRPFSLDAKLDDVDSLIPAGYAACEIRLLAVEPGVRRGPVAAGLIAAVARHARSRGRDLALISATTRQIRLYRHLGFESFGKLVGTTQARFQPMYLTLERFLDAESRSDALQAASPGTAGRKGEGGNFLPGPVEVSTAVEAAFGAASVSHRGELFSRELGQLRRRLCRAFRARDVQVLTGGGTLANDVVAGQLSLMNESGLVLVNGEFGRRLAAQARGARLDFATIAIPEGEAFGRDEVAAALDRHPGAAWLWVVHGETSTGVLNDLEACRRLCAGRGIRLCLDVVSTIGTVPLDLTDVFLATASSGKGLASRAGLALVFHGEAPLRSDGRLPAVLDLELYQRADGVPFTIASQPVEALSAALDSRDLPARYRALERWSQETRLRLEKAGVKIVAPAAQAMPAVVSVVLPRASDSISVGEALEARGVQSSYRSRYLRERNWIQVCMMGSEIRSAESFVSALAGVLGDTTR